MRLEDRFPTEHAALVIFEFLGGVLAVLCTFLVLFAGAVAIHAVVVGVSDVGVPPVVGASLSQSVALLALALLLACGRLVVAEYRRFLEQSPKTRSAIALTAGPLVGVATPLLYARYVAGTMELPWPVVGLTVVAAHALAFRTISLWSRDSELARFGELVGIVAGAPLVFTLVTFLTERVLFGWLDDAGQLLLTIPGWEFVPRDGLFLVAFPLVVSVAFGLYRLLWKHDHVEVADSNLPHVREMAPDFVFVSVGQWLPAVTLTGVAMALVNRIDDYFSRKWRRVAGSTPADSPPVHTPAGTQRKRSVGERAPSSTASRRSPSGSSRQNDPPGPRPPSSPSSSASSFSGKERGARGKQGGKSVSVEDDSRTEDGIEENTDAESTADRERETSAPDTDTHASASGSSVGTETDSDDPEPDESTSEVVDEDGDSRTQIYTPDVDEADEGAAGSVIQTCPNCTADVPSDGSYGFCPLCGTEL